MMEIRPARTQDREAVRAVLTEAFRHDPLMSAMMAPAPDPLAALDHLHDIDLRFLFLPEDGQASGGVVDLVVEESPAGQSVLGVALWEGPAPQGSDGAWERVVAARDERVLGPALTLMEIDDALCAAHWPEEDSWYLAMLAVSSRARGRGVGSALLRHGIERAQASGLPAHLEATTPASRRLYERFGFTVRAELTSAELPTYWAMRRPVQP